MLIIHDVSDDLINSEYGVFWSVFMLNMTKSDTDKCGIVSLIKTSKKDAALQNRHFQCF